MLDGPVECGTRQQDQVHTVGLLRQRALHELRVVLPGDHARGAREVRILDGVVHPMHHLHLGDDFVDVLLDRPRGDQGGVDDSQSFSF